MDDDIFEIEVTDLRAGPTPAPTVVPTGGVPEPGGPPAHTPMVTRPLHGPSPLAARRRTRGRLLAGTGALVALALALVAMLASMPGPRTALGLLFATPTATAPGADTFEIANDAPWGTLTADGRAIARDGFGYQPAFFRLDGGTHHLVFNAPPFPALRCQVSVPAAPTDTCPLLTNVAGSYVPFGKVAGESIRVLDLRATVDNLPLGAKQQLMATAQSLLGNARWNTPIQPGEHYLAADGSVRVALTPLRAALALGLSIDLNSVANINGTSCVILCTYSAPASVNGGWLLLAAVTASWTIATPDGTAVTKTPLSPAQPSATNPFPAPITPLPLAATWNGDWHVAFGTDPGGPFGSGIIGANAATTAASQVLCNLAQVAAAGLNTPAAANGVDGWYGLAAHPADGCVVVNQTTSATQQLTGQPELLLYRFGVLLAASDLAHKLNPALPVADAYERAVAKQAARAALPPQFATTG